VCVAIGPSPRGDRLIGLRGRAGKTPAPAVRVLKKYPNRRLYDTQTSSYITLADVKQMVLSLQDFVVRDAKTSEDLTRSILLQIILEEETGGLSSTVRASARATPRCRWTSAARA